MANEDYISREQTLEKFCDYIGSGMSMDDYDALYDIVAKMPSVQPKTDVLDKIRAEIEEKEEDLDYTKVSDVALKYAYIKVLKMIDKYRTEG